MSGSAAAQNRGMSASATIKIDGVENALLIPVDALNRTSSGYYVYTECDEESGTLGGMVEVTAGISNSVYVEITSGLSEGDTVYYTEKEDSAFSFDSHPEIKEKIKKLEKMISTLI